MIPMATELEPLTPHPMEIALSLVGLLTIAFCVFVAVQVLRGRWTGAQVFALIVLAILLPLVGPIVGLWLMSRASRRAAAPAH